MGVEELWPGGPRLIQKSGVFRLGMDSVLLAAFAEKARAKRACDLGAGSGVVSILLAARSAQLDIDAVELSPEAAALCRENVLLNGLEGRIRTVEGDLRDCRALLKAGSYDLVITNPPYFPMGGGKVPGDAAIAAARGELGCTLSDVCAAAGYLLRWGGRFFIVHRPERLAELIAEMRSNGLEPKRLRTVSHRAEKPPSLILAEGVRGARPGLRFEAPLVLSKPDGGDTDEVKAIYHRD